MEVIYFKNKKIFKTLLISLLILTFFAFPKLIYAENLFTSVDLNTDLYTTYGFEPVFNGAIYNWSSSGVGNSLNLDTDTLVNGKLISPQNLNFVNYGYGFRINTPTLLKNNYMYTYTGLYCFDSSISISDSNIYTSGSFNTTTKNGRNVTRATNFSYYDTAITDSEFTYCYFVYNTFTSFNNTFVLTQQLSSSSGSKYGVLVGFKLDELTATDGLTSSQIETIVDNSNAEVKQEISEMNTNITNQTNKVDDSINNMKDEIIGPDTKYDNVDDSGLNDYKDNEDALINKDSLNNINNIQMSVDSNTNLFIWNIISSILNTHTLIFNMVITFLSIGVIKLILNR